VNGPRPPPPPRPPPACQALLPAGHPAVLLPDARAYTRSESAGRLLLGLQVMKDKAGLAQKLGQLQPLYGCPTGVRGPACISWGDPGPKPCTPLPRSAQEAGSVTADPAALDPRAPQDAATADEDGATLAAGGRGIGTPPCVVRVLP
jgi:hypothetical protein